MQKEPVINNEIKAKIANRQRDAILKFMRKNNLNSNSWSRMAGIAESTIRHFLSGRNQSITTLNLELLAKSINATPHELMWE